MLTVLTQASQQWAKRPDDERFVSLDDMLAHFRTIRGQSAAKVVPSRRLTVVPGANHRDLAVQGPAGNLFAPTHWAFGQLANLVGAPAGYLRSLPAPIAADNLNFGLQFRREIEDVGVLLQQNGTSTLRAVNGPNYGRIWNSDIVEGLVDRLPEGWTVPGEFGVALPEVTKANTTLYASDRDMFVFLADEEHRIEIPDRRDGKSGALARGIFVWNSEVGSATFGVASFLFDYACRNRMVWGAHYFRELTMRHTSKAPDRFIEEMRPALESFANGSATNVLDAVAAARKARIDGTDGALDEFLGARFGKRLSGIIQQTHIAEEGRPIESLWDATTAVTAYARTITYQDERVDLERKGGALLALASA
jgi:hypothetical protein